MALAETAELAVRLTLDDKMTPAIRKAQGGLRTLGNTARTVGKGIAVGAGVVAAAGIVALTGAIRNGITALRQDKVVTAQTEAVIRSTGGAAGVSAKQVEDLADSLSTLNGVQDDVVQGAENVILRFTNIGKDIFPQVTQAAIDMAAATGGDAAGAALKLSRALDNPIQSLGALTRVGITFSKQEKAQIEDLVKHNKLSEAQAIVLAKVKQKFDGVAQGMADADPSLRLNVAIEKFQKSLAEGLLPVIEKVQTRLTHWLTQPGTLATVNKIGDAIGALFTDENLDAAASAIETAAKAVGTAISAFNQLPAPIKALAIGAFAINKVTGGAVTGAAEVFGKLLGAGLQKIFAANVTVIGANVTGGGGGLPGAAGALGEGGLIAGATAAIPVVLVAGSIAALTVAFISAMQTAPDHAPGKAGLTPSQGGDVFGVGHGFGPRSGHGRRTDLAQNTGPGLSDIAHVISRPLEQLAAKLRMKELGDKLDHNIDKLGKLQQQLQHAKESGDERRTQNLRDRIDRTNQRIDSEKQALTSTTVQTRDAARHAGYQTSGTVSRGTAAIVSAIFAAVPNINLFVTASNVEAAMNVGGRAGPRNGSAKGGDTRQGGSGQRGR